MIVVSLPEAIGARGALRDDHSDDVLAVHSNEAF